jgi:hypothetical protein
MNASDGVGEQRIWVTELRRYLGMHLLGYGEPILLRDP